MPPVGNDVVDLKDPDNFGKSRDGRFLKRVFTPEERGRIAAAERPNALIWSLWAAKEAAYKCVSRKVPAVASAPRRYPVFLEDTTKEGKSGAPGDGFPMTGRVETPQGAVALRIDGTEDYVHALAAPSAASLIGIVVRILPVDIREPAGGASAFVRGLLIAEIACRLDCPASDLAVSPSGSGAPKVSLRGRPLDLDVSLSHDGRYGAVALDATSLVQAVSPLTSRLTPRYRISRRTEML